MSPTADSAETVEQAYAGPRPPPSESVDLVGTYVRGGRELFEFASTPAFSFETAVQANEDYSVMAGCLERQHEWGSVMRGEAGSVVWHPAEVWVVDGTWSAVAYGTTGPFASGEQVAAHARFRARATGTYEVVVRAARGQTCNATSLWVTHESAPPPPPRRPPPIATTQRPSTPTPICDPGSLHFRRSIVENRSPKTCREPYTKFVRACCLPRRGYEGETVCIPQHGTSCTDPEYPIEDSIDGLARYFCCVP